MGLTCVTNCQNSANTEIGTDLNSTFGILEHKNSKHNFIFD